MSYIYIYIYTRIYIYTQIYTYMHIHQYNDGKKLYIYVTIFVNTSTLAFSFFCLCTDLQTGMCYLRLSIYMPKP